ncbi:MAG: hypothetical protein M0Z71_07120 [Nitrospiraceae bacterium]|nr:hypothetical protein [Nitrospiraceae bacterium]
MPSRKYYPGDEHDEADIYGNNAAFCCPAESCGKVFITNTTRMNDGFKKCPKCGKSRVTLKAEGRRGTRIVEATIEWD